MGQPWVAAQPDAIGIARTSLTPSLDSVEVSQTPRSESTILDRRRPPSSSSHDTSSWSPMNWNSFLPKLWKLLESAPTSTSSRPSVRTWAISVCESIPSTSSESTRCCRALELIDSRLVCEVPTVSHRVSSLEFELDSHSCPSESETTTSLLPRSSPTSEVQVPRPTKDLPFQEVRLHQVQPTRLRGGHQDRRHRSRRCHLPVPPQPRPSLQVEETDGLI